MVCIKIKISELRKVNSWGSSNLAGCSSGRTAGWVVRQKTAWCMAGGRADSGETAERFALLSCAPHHSELQGFQVLHTRCKMGTGPGQIREPSHLHWCERQYARLWKPTSCDYIPHAISILSEYMNMRCRACALHPAVSPGSNRELLSVQILA